jgi:orotate phosphoribosyltransferase
MEVHYDLRKFITELPVARSRGVLSSGREASGADGSFRVIAERGEVGPVWGAPGAGRAEREFVNVGRLTLGAGIESSTAMGSDLWAAEALQEAETEVGVAVMVDRSVGAAVRVAGQTLPDRLTRRAMSALRPES